MQRSTRQSSRRILRHLTFWLFLPLLLLLALRLYWGHHAATRLARLRAQLHAQGLKVYSWFLTPLAVEQSARGIQALADQIPIVQAANYPRAHVLNTAAMSWNWSDTMLNWSVSSEDISRTTRSLGAIFDAYQYDFLACRRGVSMLLAAQLYAAEHGAPPFDAAQLVPDYLLQVPLDPYADPEQPLQYHLDPDGPTVQTVPGRMGLVLGAAHLQGTARP